MEQLIQSILRVMGVEGTTLEDIHDACIKRGWREEDIYLSYIAAENLYNAIKKQERELAKRKPPFGRK